LLRKQRKTLRGLLYFAAPGILSEDMIDGTDYRRSVEEYELCTTSVWSFSLCVGDLYLYLGK